MTQTAQRNYVLIGYRLENKLKQREFADKLGISQGLLSQFERGTKNPSFQLAKEIASFIGVDIGLVFPKYQL